MTQLFVNNFAATVAQTFGVADQYLYLNTVTGLPALTGGNYLLLTLFRKVGVVESGHEVVKVTAITDLMLTVERSVEGADATLFNVGDRVEARVTAGALGLKADVADAYVHPANHPSSIITQDASNRFVTDAEKAAWNAKQAAGTYATGTGTATGTNTGDQDLSGKQNVLVSGTSIKTVNSTSLLGSGNIVTGDVTLAGVQTLTNKTITDIVFALTGTTPAFTATNGGVQTWTLSGASTPTNSLTSGQSIILVITPGANTITWPAGTIWTKQGGSGAAPTLFSAGKTSVVLWMVGAVLYGSHLGDTV